MAGSNDINHETLIRFGRLFQPPEDPQIESPIAGAINISYADMAAADIEAGVGNGTITWKEVNLTSELLAQRLLAYRLYCLRRELLDKSLRSGDTNCPNDMVDTIRQQVAEGRVTLEELGTTEGELADFLQNWPHYVLRHEVRRAIHNTTWHWIIFDLLGKARELVASGERTWEWLGVGEYKLVLAFCQSVAESCRRSLHLKYRGQVKVTLKDLEAVDAFIAAEQVAFSDLGLNQDSFARWLEQSQSGANVPDGQPESFDCFEEVYQSD